MHQCLTMSFILWSLKKMKPSSVYGFLNEILLGERVFRGWNEFWQRNSSADLHLNETLKSEAKYIRIQTANGFHVHGFWWFMKTIFSCMKLDQVLCSPFQRQLSSVPKTFNELLRNENIKEPWWFNFLGNSTNNFERKKKKFLIKLFQPVHLPLTSAFRKLFCFLFLSNW